MSACLWLQRARLAEPGGSGALGTGSSAACLPAGSAPGHLAVPDLQALCPPPALGAFLPMCTWLGPGIGGSGRTPARPQAMPAPLKCTWGRGLAALPRLASSWRPSCFSLLSCVCVCCLSRCSVSSPSSVHVRDTTRAVPGAPRPLHVSRSPGPSGVLCASTRPEGRQEGALGPGGGGADRVPPAQACGCPLYWKGPLFCAAGGERTGAVSVHKFVAMWRK